MKLPVFALSLVTSLAVAQSCTLCPGGGIPNRTMAVPFSDNDCGQLEKIAMRADESACDTLQKNAAWCQCPGVVPKCTLCAEGESPSDVNLVMEEKNATCGELEYLATVAHHESACNRVTAYASACGCGGAGVYEESYTCTGICPDGSPIAADQYGTIVGETNSGENRTCGDFQADVTNGLIKEQEKCDMYAYIGVHVCGCNESVLTEPKCKLCENNQVP